VRSLMVWAGLAVVYLEADAPRVRSIEHQVWNTARRAGQKLVAADLRGARYALWKNPENLTQAQQTRLAWVAKTNKPPYRAYLLKER
jgi:transposase